jgi:hypothetical protein
MWSGRGGRSRRRIVLRVMRGFGGDAGICVVYSRR